MVELCVVCTVLLSAWYCSVHGIAVHTMHSSAYVRKFCVLQDDLSETVQISPQEIRLHLRTGIRISYHTVTAV